MKKFESLISWAHTDKKTGKVKLMKEEQDL